MLEFKDALKQADCAAGFHQEEEEEEEEFTDCIDHNRAC